MIVNLTKKFATDLENSENSKQAQNIALINWEWFGILHATLRKPLQKRRVMAISCNEIVFHFLVSFTLSILFWETLWSYSYCEYNRWKTGWIFRIFLYYYIVLFIITEFICSNQEVKQVVWLIIAESSQFYKGERSWISVYSPKNQFWGKLTPTSTLPPRQERLLWEINLWFLLVFVFVNPKNIKVCTGVASFHVCPNF